MHNLILLPIECARDDDQTLQRLNFRYWEVYLSPKPLLSPTALQSLVSNTLLF